MAGRIPPARSRENGPNAAQGALVLGCVIHDMGDFRAFRRTGQVHIHRQPAADNDPCQCIRNKRIAAEKNAAETSEDAPVAK